MSATLVHAALTRRLQSMPDRPPIAYPNGPGVATLPRLVVQRAGQSQRTDTVGGTTEVRAELAVRVETATDDYTGESDAIVAAIVAHFPVGARFDGVTVTDAPDPRPPLIGGGVYAVPVIVRGLGHF